MDKERKKRLQTVRLIVTEIIMVIVVIVTVVVLTFIAMGYNVNKDGDLAQSGLVQIKSQPTGATVFIDGEAMLSKTNMNRMVSSGEHEIKLEKEGYGSWTKKVTAESGWLLKLEYPRLFLAEREKEEIAKEKAEIEFFLPSPDRAQVLYATKGSAKWKLLDIRGDVAEETELDLTTLLSIEKSTELVAVKEITWNKNGDRVLIRAERKGETEWLMVNTRDVSRSVNLTKEFGMKFTQVSFANGAGERVYALENGNLRSMVVSEKTISQVLAADVAAYYNDGAEVVYLTNKQEAKRYQEGAEDVLLANFREGQKVLISVSEYLSKRYLTMIVGGRAFIYQGNLPTVAQELASMELVLESDLFTTPESLSVYAEGELIIARNGAKLSVFDAELLKLHEFETESDPFFAEDYMIGAVSDGKLVVRDFDGENRRELSETTLAATISRNNKYIYYADNDTIYRERIMN